MWIISLSPYMTTAQLLVMEIWAHQCNQDVNNSNILDGMIESQGCVL